MISFRDIISIGKWPVSECSAKIKPTQKRYFFISHPWLSESHPDPNGVKFSIIKDWYDGLIAFRSEIINLYPKDVDRSARKKLCQTRCTVAPIILDEHDEEINNWHSGFSPPPGLWLDEDTEPNIVKNYWLL